MNPELAPPVEQAQGSLLSSNDLARLDPETSRLIELEETRQAKKLIFIASESICPAPVREALASPLGNIYAEGYPSWRMTDPDNDRPLDFTHHLAYQRRYADYRYYKGCEYINFIESLAQKRCAALFATDSNPNASRSIRAEQIQVNVQPLSGAAANNAVYQAFVAPGDTVMGMHLNHGGHLTHGSPANRSGKFYSIIPYTVDRKTGSFDLDAMRSLLLESKPKLLIAGASAYPWAIDWAGLRDLCDSVDPRPLLHADLAHPAGLTVAGRFPNPIGLADVVTFTTHKTLCGPRGAVILTTDPELAHRIDGGVFPGEQGGPHQHSIAAKAAGFAWNATPSFHALMHGVADNAIALADSLQEEGLSLVYGGTDTHLLLVDLTRVKTPTGHPLTGEIASRILDQIGLTCNKNAVPGDENPAHPGAVRLGTTWVTQRGLGPEDMKRIASVVARTLTNIHSFQYSESSGYVGRGKIDLGLARELTQEVESIASSAQNERDVSGTHWHYPHTGVDPLPQPDRSFPGQIDVGLLHASGIRCHLFLQSATTSDISCLEPGEGKRTYLLDRRNELVGEVEIYRLQDLRPGHRAYLLLTDRTSLSGVREWLRALSDGYTLFDDHDVYRKVEGPALVIDWIDSLDPENRHVAVLASSNDPALPPLRCLENSTLKEGSKARLLLHSELAGARLALFRSSEADQILAQIASEDASGPRWSNEPPGTSTKDLLTRYPERFDLEQVYFVGQQTALEATPPSSSKQPAPDLLETEMESPLRQTPLYAEHLELSRKSWIIPFGGWEMPVRFSSIEEEHQAVRTTAGLFDVAHMGTVEVRGPHAQRFLDAVTTNYAAWLRDGEGHYCYLLDPNGRCLDDLLLYRRAWDRYLLVVNAANAEIDLAWLRAAASKQFVIDTENQRAEIDGEVEIIDLKDPAVGEDRLVDLAFQGPLALEILQQLAGSSAQANRLQILKRFGLAALDLGGIPALLARTGYTGEPVGYEIYVHPDRLVELWRAILEIGEPRGVRPCGLGARDSTRTEAGYPLHGHELAGPHNISPIEAGYGPFVKFHKPFFIGRSAMLHNEQTRTQEVVRFRVKDPAVRMVRPGDPVASRRGVAIGWVTSSTQIGGEQIGLASIDRRQTRPGTECSVFRLPKPGKAPEEPAKHLLQLGDPAVLSEKIEILPRFWTKAICG